MEPKPEWARGCTCPLDYRGLGILYGISLGQGWVRLDDAPDCPVHAGMSTATCEVRRQAP